MSREHSSFERIKGNKCDHKNELDKRKLINESYIYCFNCNRLILIYNNKAYLTYKLISEEDAEENRNIEFDPILSVRIMIQRQEEQIKEINDKLVLNFSNNFTSSTNFNLLNSSILNESEKSNNSGITNIDKDLEFEKTKKKIKNIKNVGSESISNYNSTSNREKNNNNNCIKPIFDEKIFEKYAKNRNKILIYIHKLCTKLQYNDGSFYLSLYLIDTYLSRIFSDDITERELFLVILGFFLISSKYIEDDIFEPEFQLFCNINKSLVLTTEEIRTSEVQCLTLINYNLYLYSVYDWVNILLNNGILFENEINDIKDLKNIYIYIQQLLTLATSKIYFFKYSSLHIALSIVHLGRDKYLNNKEEISKNLYNLLLSLYGIKFYDYEECYNIIKNDLVDNNDIEFEDDTEKTNSNTYSKTNIYTNEKNIKIKLNKSNNITLNEERNKSNLSTSVRKKKFKIFLNSNKGKKYSKTDYNINLKRDKINENKYKSSFGQINFLNHKKKFKCNEKKYEFLDHNSIDILRDNYKNLSPNIMNSCSIHNTSFKSCNYISKEPRHLMINCYKKDLKLNLNKDNNIVYINYSPKFLINNNSTKINNINYINNININNKVINLYSGNKKKKIHKNISSGLNFNFCYKINNKENKKSIINTNKTNKEINYECNINNININNNIKNNKNNHIHITTSQNIIEINNEVQNALKNHKKMNSNNKEKYKTHLILDISSNPNYKRNEKNEVVEPPKRETKSCNKYSFNGYNNINNNKKQKTFKIHLGRENKIRIMNTNININLNNQVNKRKFTINFKDIVNKKLNKERENKFVTREKNENIKRFKSLNNNIHTVNKNKMNNKTKSKKNNNHFIIEKEKENKRINDKISDKIKRFENNIKSLNSFNPTLPQLKYIKNFLFKK